MLVEVEFPVRGDRIPSCHGYQLLSAICVHVPKAHNHTGLGVHTIPGLLEGQGTLMLHENPMIRLRGLYDEMREYVQLGGKTLFLGGHTVRVGPPTFRVLEPAPNLHARIVDLKTPDEAVFWEHLNKRLTDLGIEGDVKMGKRKVVQVHNRNLVGFGVTIRQITSAESSLNLLKSGLGIKRKFGCGLFEVIS